LSEELTDHRILWRRLDESGHEAARLFQRDSFWHLIGTALFVHDYDPCKLDYHILCNRQWETVSATISGWLGNREIGVVLNVDGSHRWSMNGVVCEQVTGCIDLDLNFSPITNLLPIRRLNLSIDEKQTITAAWLRFPSFALESLEQVYQRTKLMTYRYVSGGGRFTADLTVDDAGFVTNYPGFWEAEATFDFGPVHAE
jgi:hypothetical protein